MLGEQPVLWLYHLLSGPFVTTRIFFIIGHEIVATIAQIYLHPTVLPTLCRILDQSPHCHLAPIATWADKIKYHARWSAALHYVGAIDDYPPNHCAYPGPSGWEGKKEINVLDGIKNVTGLLADWVVEDASDATASEALKFLVHFVGDMHQPMHLTGRDRGGNSAKVVWDGRHTSKLFFSFLLLPDSLLFYLRPSLTLGWPFDCQSCPYRSSKLLPPSTIPCNRESTSGNHLRFLYQAYYVGRYTQQMGRRNR